MLSRLRDTGGSSAWNRRTRSSINARITRAIRDEFSLPRNGLTPLRLIKCVGATHTPLSNGVTKNAGDSVRITEDTPLRQTSKGVLRNILQFHHCTRVI